MGANSVPLTFIAGKIQGSEQTIYIKCHKRSQTLGTIVSWQTKAGSIWKEYANMYTGIHYKTQST